MAERSSGQAGWPAAMLSAHPAGAGRKHRFLPRDLPRLMLAPRLASKSAGYFPARRYLSQIPANLDPRVALSYQPEKSMIVMTL